jgi:arylsulfatase A-like enzyme
MQNKGTIMNRRCARRGFLKQAGLGLAVVMLFPWLGKAAAPGSPALENSTAKAARHKPNVLFIAVDDLRPELGCYGRGHVHSPNIDRLAGQGMVFNRAYCQYAMCGPSRASLLTGLRPDSTGVYDLKTHFRRKMPDVVTLPQQFKLNGYQTQEFGKVFHGAFATPHHGVLDDPQSWSKPSWKGSPQYYFTPEGIEVARGKYARKFKKSGAEVDDWKKEFVPALATEAPDVPDSTLYDGEMTDLAIQALGELKGKPFFLAVGYLKPHLPFVAPKKYWDLYDRAAVDMPSPAAAPKDAPAVALRNGNELRGQYTDMRNDPLSEAQTRELRHGYYACVSFVDALIGRLIDELDRLNLRENTIIVLWGDHGWHLGEQNIWGKITDFELDAHAPLIVSAPGRNPGGATCNALVEFVDIFPSLCELAGLPLPPHLEGTSFVPLLDAPDSPWKPAALTQVMHGAVMGRSVRTDRYRFTRWQNTKAPNQTVAVELYDYLNDPVEVENIANRPENAGLVKELTAKWEAAWALPHP